jgi:DNA-binding NarL/FixJ family response regulator
VTVFSPKISIVIIDDHPLFRQGVGDILSLEEDFEILGYASDGLEGLELIREKEPDIAIVDVNLPGMNGQALATQVVYDRLRTRLILLTGYDDIYQRAYAMQCGAYAYCTKDVQPSLLIDIIRGVSQGYYYLNGQQITADELQRWFQVDAEGGSENPVIDNEGIIPLSPREMEVLIFLTQGHSNKEIAQSLGISHQTVKNHVTAIMRKIGVGDRTQAALYALQRGWVQLYRSHGE